MKMCYIHIIVLRIIIHNILLYMYNLVCTKNVETSLQAKKRCNFYLN